MNNEPVTMGAALQGVVVAVGAVVVAATKFDDALDVAIAGLAIAVGFVVNVRFARKRVTPTN